jgi:hypothetical protein
MALEGDELEVIGQVDGGRCGEEAGKWGGWLGIGAMINCLVIYSKRPLHSLRTFALLPGKTINTDYYRNWVGKTNIVELKTPRRFSFGRLWGCWMLCSFLVIALKADPSDMHFVVLVTELGIHLLNLRLVVVWNRLEGITCLVTSFIGSLP